MFLYNFCVAVYARLIALASFFDRMARTISPSDRIVWIHVASLGEFEQGRPVMEQIKANYPHYKILLTFFSPSGYEVRKDYKGADYIFYMPIDTPRNVRRFLDLAHPEIAIFVKYEFWINYLTQLKRRGTRTFVISAIFRRNSVFFRPYGGMWRQALEAFDTMFVQNEESKKLLATLGFDNVLVAGDTRFICLNTNALEFDYSHPIPDFEYIYSLLSDTLSGATRTIPVMHVGPGDVEFNNNVSRVFHELLKRFPGMQFCLHAHNHRLLTRDLFGDGIMYYGCSYMNDRNYLLFTLTPDGYAYEVVDY